MADFLKLTILSPERRLVDSAPVSVLSLTGSEGQIQILPGHAPIVGALLTGTFSYRTPSGSDESGHISTGFFEVAGDQVTVLAETIELSGEIDLIRARKAQEKAEAALQAADLDEHAFKKYQLKLQRALIRQQLAGRDHPPGNI